jgi:protein disulfide-isomerase-like protein
MKFIVLLVILGALALIKCEDSVVVLTDANFLKYLEESKVPVFLKLYAPWCGHCQKMAPEYIQAAMTAKAKNANYVFAEIDCTIHTKARSHFNVISYPTLFIWNEGKYEKFEGERTALGITAYMNKKFGKSMKELKTAEEIEKIKNLNIFAVISLVLIK